MRSTLFLIAIELASAAAVAGLLYFFALTVRRRVARSSIDGFDSIRQTVGHSTRRLPIGLFVVLAFATVVYNGWLIVRGLDPRSHTTALLASVTVDSWQALVLALGKIGLATLGLLIATRIVHNILNGLQSVVRRREDLKDHNLDRLFASLDRAIVSTGWLLLTTLACWLLAVPQPAIDTLLLITRVYVIFAAGLLAIRATAMVVALADVRGRTYADRRGWVAHYDHLGRLLPTLSACVEYALWIGMVALVLFQLSPVQGLAAWGPRLVEAIAIFFVGRVLIEVAHLEIDRRMTAPQGLDELALRRRATMTPLVHSVFTYAAYFGLAVLMLASLGFNPMPFLAGAGILGLVVGFGAQSLINDVVSGFFILFENVYLVGELIEVDKAKGIVEAIEFRVTKIRDDDGRLHVIRNGDMKPVINYSKGYAMAVVPVDVAYDADLRIVFHTLREAGKRVRSDDRNVVADLRVEGISAFGPSAMTVRTATRVRPGTNEKVATAIRLAIKEEFDRQVADDAPRQTLIPAAAVRARSTS
ncbi:MAG TPA: mechanosensitive ion channel family protein [Vicinamibacterales bacterium]|nr:mechanosensitive ion channel family protein [Vicinamibacterales bacterium]